MRNPGLVLVAHFIPVESGFRGKDLLDFAGNLLFRNTIFCITALL